MESRACVCRCPRCAGDLTSRATHQRWLTFMSILNERQKRLYAAERALELGHGGIELVKQVSGLSERTVRRGITEVQGGKAGGSPERVRRPGAGRPASEVIDPAVVKDLNLLLGETTAGDPMRLLRWTTKSTRLIAEELNRLGHSVSHTTVDRLLHESGYSLWGDRKSIEGKQSPLRDAQFGYIHDQVKRFQKAKIPAISVDTKKKELVGPFHNKGRRWGGEPPLVNVYDYPSLAEGPAYPYGVFDESQNQGFVNVGMTHDTAEFAVESIERWWRTLGRECYRGVKGLLITADGGGSNASRSRLWKYRLQRFADQHGLSITVCHYPPGTSKWNKVEHRLFSHISITWRGQPLVSYQTIVNFINSTTTRTGMRVKANLDTHQYETGKRITDKEMDTIALEPHNVHPWWNYTIRPRENPAKR
jgi:DDE family transposase